MFFENNNYFDMIFDKAKEEKTPVKFARGNMFDNEFISYKNMNYIMPKASSKREEDLFKIMEVNFALIDYNLFLDVHPDNSDILNKYNESAKKLETLKKEYEQKYGPLSNECAGYPTFKWLDSPWPWDKESGQYV